MLRGSSLPGARLTTWQRALVVVTAVVLAALPFFLPLSDPTAAGLLVLWCIPVALVGVLLGAAAGLVAAVVATVLLTVWDVTRGGADSAGGWVGFLARAAAFFLLGVGVGWFAGRARNAEHRMSGVLDSMLEAVILAEPVRDRDGQVIDGRITYANSISADAFNLEPEQLVGRLWSELWPDTFAPDLRETLVETLRAEAPLELVSFTLARTRDNGSAPTLLDLRATPLQSGLLVAWRDVSASHRDAQAISAVSAQFAAAFEHAPVGMVLVGPGRRIVRANEAFAAITGRRLEELSGTSMDALIDPRDVGVVQQAFAQMGNGESRAVRHETRLMTVDGGSRWVSVTAAPISDTQVVEHVVDIDDRKGFEGRLQFLADHDPLTGLINRRRFADELSHQLAIDSRYGGMSAVGLVDLDNFKYINDTLGHQVGDKFIQAIARRLRVRLRSSDVICRLGGDEFAVLLPGADSSRADGVAASLLGGIRTTEVDHAGQRVRSTGSAGIAVVTNGVSDADDVLANADLAMYAAKESGRDTHVVYDPAGPHSERTRLRFRWIERIRVALDRDLFTLLAQPILDLATGQVTGCELLLRMRDGDRLVGPDLFLPIAERHGLANPIDRLVIRMAIEIVASHPRPPGFRWEINLSADSLGDPGIPDLIESELARTGVPPHCLVFEITETAAIANLDDAQAFAARLTDIGCQFALDDFGAGYGSFYYLKHLPFEYLKIDGEFIRQLTSSSVDQVIVEAIVGAAQQLGKQTVAEYVADAPTLDRLRTLQVDHAQGYFIGHPVIPAGHGGLPRPRDAGT